jgi:hypothetical protein
MREIGIMISRMEMEFKFGWNREARESFSGIGMKEHLYKAREMVN